MNALQKSLKKVKFGVAKHSPEILIGVGCVSIISTAILAAKATPKAIEKYKEETEKKGEKLNAIETVRTCGLYYLPAAGSAAIGMASIIGSNRISNKRCVSATAAALTAETMLHAYQEKVVEQIGAKKEQAIRDDIAADKIKENPPSAESTAYVIGNSAPLWYDELSGRYFNRTKQEIDAAINKLDAAMVTGDMYCSINDYFTEVCGLPAIPADTRGFNLGTHGTLNDNIWFSSMLDQNGNPIGSINFYHQPDINYNWYGC